MRKHRRVNKMRGPRNSGPIRNIVKVIDYSEAYPFGADRVLLDCGHEVLAYGETRAHCRKCRDVK